MQDWKLLTPDNYDRTCFHIEAANVIVFWHAMARNAFTCTCRLMSKELAWNIWSMAAWGKLCPSTH